STSRSLLASPTGRRSVCTRASRAFRWGRMPFHDRSPRPSPRRPRPHTPPCCIRHTRMLSSTRREVSPAAAPPCSVKSRRAPAPRTVYDKYITRDFPEKARDLRPDVSAAPDAETQFREVVEAYEVLSKPETRDLYDRFGHAGLRGGGYRPTAFDVGSLSDLFS